jgi:type II secretory pathway pseudopilin PulG
MKNNSSPRVVMHRGLSLLELTVVIATLLSLVSVLFIGARAWKRGSERSSCILTLRNIQMATRSYQNLYGYDYGGHPYADRGTQDIAEHLYAKGYIESTIYQQARGQKKCPSGGSYSCPLPNIFPQEGRLYAECSLAGSDEHVPKSLAGW